MRRTAKQIGRRSAHPRVRAVLTRVDRPPRDTRTYPLAPPGSVIVRLETDDREIAYVNLPSDTRRALVHSDARAETGIGRCHLRRLDCEGKNKIAAYFGTGGRIDRRELFDGRHGRCAGANGRGRSSMDLQQ
ncbi:hypothetical protein BO443_130094 [Burkholderia orbicola]